MRLGIYKESECINAELLHKSFIKKFMFSQVLAAVLQAKVDYPQLWVLFMDVWTWHLKASPENHLSKVRLPSEN